MKEVIFTRAYIRRRLRYVFEWMRTHWLVLSGLLLAFVWCIPYFMSGRGVEWGDFSFFAQGYEAIRVSILEYGQFPWWNPWMAGEIPLYANPQLGVFSIQTILVLIFGTVLGLKHAVIFYTLVGYLSMYVLLTRTFAVRVALAVPLAVAWIASSFFVNHLPSHFTFVWYLLVPLFVYVTLRVRTYRGGIVLGLVFAVMALSAVHNPFFQIGLVCAGLLAIRLVYLIVKRSRRPLIHFIAMLISATVTLLVVAGHRLFFAYQNVATLERPQPSDPPLNPFHAPYAVFMPFDRSDYVTGKIFYPSAPFSWGEASSSAGLIATILFFAAILLTLVVLLRRSIRTNYKKQLVIALLVIAAALFFFTLGIGDVAKLSPYNFLKHLPVFGEMRVSTRWFLWVTLAMLILIGFVYSRLPKRWSLVMAVGCLLIVTELFVLNFGYQKDVLSRVPTEAPGKVSSYQFRQIDEFGSQHDFDGLSVPNDGLGPMFYREYEATTFNIGVIRANEPLINNRYDAVRCVEDKGCPYVTSRNATVAKWTPDAITLHRTGPGDIVLDINASRYISVNGRRSTEHKVANVKSSVVITDTSSDVTVSYSPKL